MWPTLPSFNFHMSPRDQIHVLSRAREAFYQPRHSLSPGLSLAWFLPPLYQNVFEITSLSLSVLCDLDDTSQDKLPSTTSQLPSEAPQLSGLSVALVGYAESGVLQKRLSLGPWDTLLWFFCPSLATFSSLCELFFCSSITTMTFWVWTSLMPIWAR